MTNYDDVLVMQFDKYKMSSALKCARNQIDHFDVAED